MRLTRRRFLMGSLGSIVASFGLSAAEHPTIKVYKDPDCGCCGLWVEHLKVSSFSVEVEIRSDLSKLKAQLGVPRELASCHTAMVAEYVIEGHVPAADIRRLVEERPAILGIAVGGMPIGSPGMEVEGQPAEPFDVMFFGPDTTGVFNSYPKGYRA